MIRRRTIAGFLGAAFAAGMFVGILPEVQAGGFGKTPGTLNVQVIYDTNGGPERFRADLQDDLVRELDFRECFERVVSATAFEPSKIVFRVTLAAPLEEQENSLSIHESIRARAETGEDTATYSIRLDSSLELFAPGKSLPVASTRLNKRVRYRPQFGWEDGSLQARTDLLRVYVQHAANWVCKKGKKKLR